jgi:hypothetical protein
MTEQNALIDLVRPEIDNGLAIDELLGSAFQRDKYCNESDSDLSL